MTDPVIRTLRWLAIVAVSILIVLLLIHHDKGRVKGTPVPLPNVISCFVVASVAAMICLFTWRRFMVPFVAGLAGGIGNADALSFPFAGVLGFLIGCFVLLVSSELGMPGRRDPDRNVVS